MLSKVSLAGEAYGTNFAVIFHSDSTGYPAVSAPVQQKRKLSAAGRKTIVDGAKRRWAAVKAAKAPSTRVVRRKSTLSAADRDAMAEGDWLGFSSLQVKRREFCRSLPTS
jgi:hypothetical protein